MSIPKIIHYCWFGNQKQSNLIKRCIESWKKFLPDYQIIKWDESNSVFKHPFVIEAYEKKKWAFVSDYIRLKALYEYGGIYLDTDMMLVSNFDRLLENTCFMGAESKENISCGIIGVQPKHSFINECLVKYDTILIPTDNRWYKIAIPILVTEVFIKKYPKIKVFDKLIVINDITIYPKTYFYPLPNIPLKNKLKEYINYVGPTTIAVHLWEGSWMDESEFSLLRKRKYLKGISLVLNKLFGIEKVPSGYCKKVLSCLKESIVKK